MFKVSKLIPFPQYLFAGVKFESCRIAIYLFPNSSHCSKKGIENEIADKASCERAETTNKYEEK